MRPKDSLIGQEFGLLKVIAQTNDNIDKNGVHRRMWVCECQCKKENKNIKIVSTGKLREGSVKSCGCLKDKPKRKLNKYDLSGEYGIGWTSNENEEFYFDLEDYDKIKDYTWRRHARRGGLEKGYLVTQVEHGIRGKENHFIETIFFHKLVVDYQLVDHKNGNKLDNRKQNLRDCTQSQNMMNVPLKKNNSSGIVGVTYNKKSQKWWARINPQKGKRIFLGQFSEKDDAIKARLQAEKEYYGEFAPQQHLFEQYGIN